MEPAIIAALDLSLRGAGLVAMPLDWAGDWSRVAHATICHKLPREPREADRIGRLVRVSGDVVEFVERHQCTIAAIEQYAFHALHSHAHSLGELGGVVKVLLTTRVGITVEPVQAASARKLILGKLPRSDVKIHTRIALSRMGMPKEWTDDEADAFVIGNWVASSLGGFAFAVTPPPERRARA